MKLGRGLACSSSAREPARDGGERCEPRLAAGSGPGRRGLACRSWQGRQSRGTPAVSGTTRRDVRSAATNTLAAADHPTTPTHAPPPSSPPGRASPEKTYPFALSMRAARWRTLSRSSMASGWKESSPKSSITCASPARGAAVKGRENGRPGCLRGGAGTVHSRASLGCHPVQSVRPALRPVLQPFTGKHPTRTSHSSRVMRWNLAGNWPSIASARCPSPCACGAAGRARAAAWAAKAAHHACRHLMARPPARAVL